MLRIIRLHVGLFKYLRTELKKKKNLVTLIKFFRAIIIAYFKELIKLYKESFNIFDPMYREQKQKYNKYNQYRKDINNAWKIIQYILHTGKNRTEMKQIRRDFERYGKISKELEEAILRDVYGQRR
jgi:hypothetical protein